MIDKMDRQVTIRCNGADAAALEKLQDRLPALSLSAIAREAMRIGLAAIGGDPTRLIRPRAVDVTPSVRVEEAPPASATEIP